MTSESDAEFVERIKHEWDGDNVPCVEDWSRLFALARRGAEMQAHTADKRAHSAFANSENARKGEQHTICEACGNANLSHDRAAWADDGASYCPKCFQIILATLPSPPKGAEE